MGAFCKNNRKAKMQPLLIDTNDEFQLATAKQGWLIDNTSNFSLRDLWLFENMPIEEFYWIIFSKTQINEEWVLSDHWSMKMWFLRWFLWNSRKIDNNPLKSFFAFIVTSFLWFALQRTLLFWNLELSNVLFILQLIFVVQFF